MDVKKIIAIILAVALAAVLLILIRSDRSDSADAQGSTKPVVQATADTQESESAPRYHIAVLSNSELERYPLVRIDLDGMDVPVYACSDEHGEVCFFVYAFEETTGQYGFLPAYPQYPEVRVDNGAGFAEFPRLAKGWTDGESGYPQLALASVNGEAAQLYYPSDGQGNMRDGAIPVSVEEVNHIFGAYYVFDEEHKALLCVLDGTPAAETPEPTEEPTAEPSAQTENTPEPATPTVTAGNATPSAAVTPRPTRKPTPRPSAQPTAAPSTQPTVQPSAATQQPTAAPTATPAQGGHWELVWVVDQPEVKHQEWHCHVCGKVFLDKDSCMADQAYHKEHDGVTGWHVEWVVDSPEEGHWEPVWVPDP